MPRPPSPASRPVLLPPDLNTAFLAAPAATASSLLYPTVDPDELAENLFPKAEEDEDTTPPLPATEETLVAVPGAQLHLVDPDRSVDLGTGTLSIVRLLQGGHSASPPRRAHRSIGAPRRALSSAAAPCSFDVEVLQQPLAVFLCTGVPSHRRLLRAALERHHHRVPAPATSPAPAVHVAKHS
jgi:hypothetical protein